MRTHVEFRSAKFPAYPSEDEEVNPGRFGQRLAEYLQVELTKFGVAAGDIYSEDWGWIVPIAHDFLSLWIGCGNYEEHEDGFLCFIHPSQPTIRKVFRTFDTTADVTRVADALDQVLRADPDIRDIRWWADDELNHAPA